MKHGEPFAFRPGDRFEDHYEEPDPEKEGSSVHTSNQIARLARSTCFQKSELACADCHNPHKREKGQMALFSKRCMQCHKNTDCGMHDQTVKGLTLEDNCVDCHMPKRESENMRMNLAGENVFPPLRDHFIRVDQDATQEFLYRLEAESQSNR